MLSTLKTMFQKMPGGSYAAALLAANALNFVFSLALSRNLSFEAYGIVTLLNTFWLLAGIFVTSLLQAVNHRVAYLSMQHNDATAKAFISKARKLVGVTTIAATLVWLACIPLLNSFFNIPSIWPLLWFAPVIIAGSLAAVEKGFLQGSLAFRWLAAVTVLEPLAKVVIAAILVLLGYKDIAYTSITLSVLLSVVLASIYTARFQLQTNRVERTSAFPFTFLFATIATTLASTTFITVDVLMAKHYLSPVAAGQYANLSLIGKMIFYFGSVFNTLLITFVSRAQGSGEATVKIFHRLLISTAAICCLGALATQLGGHTIVPLVFGDQASVILQYLPAYTWAMVAFTLSTTFVAYHLALQRYVIPVVSALFTIVLAAGIIAHHATISDIVGVIAFASVSQLVVVGVLHLFATRRSMASLAPTLAASQPIATGRLNILHLGFEDFRRPGSGGGAVRTHEINKRIAKRHDVTVLVSSYKGCVDRTEDDVQYVHIGLPLGYYGSILTYFMALPFAARKYDADLVVEDFAAPFSSCLSPLWNKRRTIAVVQWLNAREKSKQYHLPFWVVERIGVKLHTNYIAVSAGIAEQLRAVNPRAAVTVIGNGVPQAAFQEPLHQNRQDIVYLGRLEKEQKGLDLLLEAYAIIANSTTANVIIAGDGPDEQWFKKRIDELSLGERFIFKGRLAGAAKQRLLAQAKVVAMPSRYETFGMVAVEALSAGTPVVAFDIACLREVVPPKLGTLVPAFDIAAYAQTLLLSLELKTTPAVENRRRQFALQYNWDTLAAQQCHAYELAARMPESTESPETTHTIVAKEGGVS